MATKQDVLTALYSMGTHVHKIKIWQVPVNALLVSSWIQQISAKLIVLQFKIQMGPRRTTHVHVFNFFILIKFQLSARLIVVRS